MRLCALLICAVFLISPAFAQSDNRKFDVADIHTSPKANGGIPPVVRGPFYTTGRYELRFATMVDLISAAYGVDPDRVYGGPSWLEMDRFDIFAKVSGNTNAESRKAMLRALLADRFNLVVKQDTKPVAAFALTAGKKPLLKESDENAPPGGCDFSVEQGKQAPPNPGGGGPQVINMPTLIYSCRNITLANFASNLADAPVVNQYLDNKTIVDQTDLKGSYDITLKYTPKIPAGINVVGDSMPLFDAIDKQLGLKLEAATVPVPVLNVASVNEKPTPNPPDLNKIFPPEPAEFDVAEIKPAPPPTPGQGNQPEIKNGRLYLPGISLQNLIQVAWDLPPDNDHLVGATKGLNEARYDIIAKAPAGVALGDLSKMGEKGLSINIDALRPMLQNLLIERFKMKIHTEERPVPSYTLLATSKPKLKPADPNERTTWHQETNNDASKERNASSAPLRQITCHNMTMAQFADMLRNIAPGYVRNDVIDATNIQGGFDFTLSFSPSGALQQAGVRSAEGGGTASAGVGEAATPNGAISLFEGIQKLGLKLEEQKRPAMVLVIDHIEPKPTDN
ncbi:MAG TPA: TIGR03435 family protein [Verrucomicrobiae bacterium]|nr:TIGR03435 family protein [Verrucomicrobiae bacterium]